MRVSSNPKVLPHAIAATAAQAVLSALRVVGAHAFVPDDVSITDPDVPAIAGHRQVTDAHLLALARRRGLRLVTFDAGLRSLSGGQDVELLAVV